MFKHLKCYWLMAKPISVHLNREQWLVLQEILQITISKYESVIGAWAYPEDPAKRRRLGQDIVTLLRKIRKSAVLTDPVFRDSPNMVTRLQFSRRALVNICLVTQYVRRYVLPSLVRETVEPFEIAKCSNVYKVATQIEKALERLVEKTSQTRPSR
jgi:hypothetical protein